MEKQIKNGLLIAIEGIDGSGKSSLAAMLADKLGQHFETVLTKEPGGTLLGKALREILQHQKEPTTSKAEFLLFAADRAQHFETVIFPNLEQGKIIISDRLADSSICYQGYGRGLDINLIQQINNWAMCNKKPDLILFVDISVEEAFKRINKRNDEITAFEKQEFIKKVKVGFETIYKSREDVITLDGMLNLEQLTEKAFEEIIKYFNLQVC